MCEYSKEDSFYLVPCNEVIECDYYDIRNGLSSCSMLIQSIHSGLKFVGISLFCSCFMEVCPSHGNRVLIFKANIVGHVKFIRNLDQ